MPSRSLFPVKSMKVLDGLHKDLRILVVNAATFVPFPFILTDGLRTLDKQKHLVSIGASKTLNSRHLTGHAVDVAPVIEGQVRWDWPLFHQINEAFKQSSLMSDIPYEWGGDWKTFPDGPHFQLPEKEYPADG